MNMRKALCMFLMCALVLGCVSVSGAASTQEAAVVEMESLPRMAVKLSALKDADIKTATRAFGDFSADIGPESISRLGNSFNLNVKDTISYNCTYTPKNASVDFGFIAPDGYFYYENCTTGSINKTFRVSQRGSYTLAIYNNSSNTVTVTGTVNY